MVEVLDSPQAQDVSEMEEMEVTEGEKAQPVAPPAPVTPTTHTTAGPAGSPTASGQQAIGGEEEADVSIVGEKPAPQRRSGQGPGATVTVTPPTPQVCPVHPKISSVSHSHLFSSSSNLASLTV